MSNDLLGVFEPGFSGDDSDSEARSLIDAWRDEWHLEPEPELDGTNSQVYESLVGYIAAALAQARKETWERAITAAGDEMHSHPSIEAESLCSHNAAIRSLITALEFASKQER